MGRRCRPAFLAGTCFVAVGLPVSHHQNMRRVRLDAHRATAKRLRYFNLSDVFQGGIVWFFINFDPCSSRTLWFIEILNLTFSSMRCVQVDAHRATAKKLRFFDLSDVFQGGMVWFFINLDPCSSRTLWLIDHLSRAFSSMPCVRVDAHRAKAVTLRCFGLSDVFHCGTVWFFIISGRRSSATLRFIDLLNLDFSRMRCVRLDAHRSTA